MIRLIGFNVTIKHIRYGIIALFCSVIIAIMIMIMVVMVIVWMIWISMIGTGIGIGGGGTWWLTMKDVNKGMIEPHILPMSN